MAILRKSSLQHAPRSPSSKRYQLHSDLVRVAAGWLRRKGSRCVITDDMKFYSSTGELPDVVGWMRGVSVLVEVKTSRADYLKDKKKPFRQKPETGIGQWRFYLCPAGIITPDDLPDGWGLLWVDEKKRVSEVSGVPRNTGWNRVPFEGNLNNERNMLVSALRRKS